MNKKRNPRRAVVLSVFTLLLCASMLIGSTFAWFTDTASTKVNTIQSGNLDMVLEYWNGTEWKAVDAETKLFKDGALWEPGYTDVAYLRVRNDGNLAFKYQLAVNISKEDKGTNVNGQEFALSQYIQFGAVESATEISKYATREAAWDAVKGKTASLNTYKSEGVLLPKVGETEAGVAYLALVAYMPTTTGNEANHNGTQVPSITLGVTVNATQTPHEFDSFGKDYDNVLSENERRATNDAELAEILNNLNDVDTIYLGAGTFSAFNLGTATFDLVGTVNADGSPATKILQNTSFTNDNFWNQPAGLWYGHSGVIENIVFEANEGIANGSMNSYDALFVQEAKGVTFRNCQFVNQGIHFTGDVDFADCVFDGKNHAKKALNYCVVPDGATSTLTNCVIKDYTDCGINVAESAGSLTIDGCEVSNSQATDEFGIHIGQINALTIKNSTLNCDVKYYSSLTGSFNESGNTFGNGYSVKAE